MLRRHIATVLIFLTAASACLAWPLNQKPDAPKVDLKKMKATVEALERPVTLQFVDTPLPDVVRFLGDYSKLKFGWDYEVLPDRAIRITVTDQPFGEALQTVVHQCGWMYSVRPDGEILLQLAPKEKK